jgi:hypothetical protein
VLDQGLVVDAIVVLAHAHALQEETTAAAVRKPGDPGAVGCTPVQDTHAAADAAPGPTPIRAPAAISGAMSSLRNRLARACVRIDNAPFVRLRQQQCRARAWDGSVVRKEPTAQLLPAEVAATPSVV